MAKGQGNTFEDYTENSISRILEPTHDDGRNMYPSLKCDTKNVSNNSHTDSYEQTLFPVDNTEKVETTQICESLIEDENNKITSDTFTENKLNGIFCDTENYQTESTLMTDVSTIENSIKVEGVNEKISANISLEKETCSRNSVTMTHMVNEINDDLGEVIQSPTNNNYLLYKTSKSNNNGCEASNIENITSVKLTEKPIVRYTLADDSQLVKISLLPNPKNLMQSNALLLSKSRNFFNFITEKSTNIMEKTLLPQHIANKYGAILKQTEPMESGVEPIESPLENSTSCPDSNITIADTSENINANGNNDHENRVEETLKQNDLNEPDTSSVILTNETSTLFSFAPKIDCLSSETFNSASSIDSSNLLHSPVYQILLQDHTALKTENGRLLSRIRQLEERNQQLEAEKNGEIYIAQIKTLEKKVEQLTHDLKVSITNQETLTKEFAAANKDRENMVMKYAIGEKQLIDVQRAKDNAERKLKELIKDHELLQTKFRQGQNERMKICNILDSKCSELVESQKQLEKLKENVNVKDVKLKWVQNKLKTEMEAHKDTQQKLEKAMIQINHMKEECDQVRRETQESIRQFQMSEENKAVTLDQQLKEQQARLIMERHVTEDKEMLRMQLQKEVDLLKHRQEVLIEENNTLSLKIQDLEKDRLNYESNLSNLKIVADQRQKEIVDLVAKVSQLETLKLQLKHQEQCLASTEAEVERLRHANEELQVDMEACRQREAHMLDFTQKLTDKNVRLQSEFSAIEAKTHRLEVEQGPLHERVVELKAKVKCLEDNLAKEQKKRTEECEILAMHVAEQTQRAQNLAQQLEDSQGENAVLKRKHQLSLKEMTRELQQYRKRLEAFETGSPNNSLDPTSRTGSNASLNTADALNGASSDNSNYGDNPIQSVEPDRQTLIDRIIKLQKLNVKRAEKLDFLEEHTRTLVEELQRKTKIIQNYILHENFDALASNERDKHKAELAKHGGIMASVYSQKISDNNMTLELSLEINQKLQAALEDILLKNITLKDNIDTLGEEIARLTIQNQKRKVN